MEIIPAIDIRGGKQVRLYQGDYDRETVYSDDPLSVAAHWAELGASRLHVVDLDGARVGTPVNLELAGRIASSVLVPVQLGGGMRDVESVKAALDAGIERVVLGTAAAESSTLVPDLLREAGEDAVAVSVDARNGKVALRGWTQNTSLSASDLVKRIEAWGVRRFVYTDVERDGTLTEPNFSAIERLVRDTKMNVLIAGGITTVRDIRELSTLGVEGAIVGKALYTGDIDLLEAMEIVNTVAEGTGEG